MIELEKLTLNDPIMCCSEKELNILVNDLTACGYEWLNKYMEKDASDYLKEHGYVYILICNDANKGIMWTRTLNRYSKPAITINDLGLVSYNIDKAVTQKFEIPKIPITHNIGVPDKYVKIVYTLKTTEKYKNTIGHVGNIVKEEKFRNIIRYRVKFPNLPDNDQTQDGCYIYSPREVYTATMADYFDGIKSSLLYKIDSKIEKEENNEMKLLDIYIKRKSDKLKEELEKERNKVLDADPLMKSLKKLQEETKDEDQVRFTLPGILNTKDMREKLDKLDHEYDTKIEELYDLKDEVESQLELCETYEQKINILKTYKVLDEAGKVNG